MNPSVSIFSFGYLRSGIPSDRSADGGGFVFDCRCLPNPVYEPSLSALSGLDAEVETYFEAFPVVEEFIAAAEAIVDIALRSYRELGYERLSVAFGCTGGQHRSVYCAERLAEHLRRQGVPVSVEHCERGVWW
ncbi:MAG: RNase adapter RapZ [Bacteroidota bacterium]|nr:RNase adapter RapZ [Bacteroidota bacterium]